MTSGTVLRVHSHPRHFGIDLLKCLSMIAICILHVMGHGGVLSSLRTINGNFLTGWMLEAVALCSVNCYALVSGYVGLNIEWKVSRLIMLLLQAWFWSMVVVMSFLVFHLAGGPNLLPVGAVFESLSPFSIKRWWYLNAYAGMFFFIPFMNKLVNDSSQLVCQRLLLTAGVMFCLIPTIREYGIFNLAGGSSFWLMTLYISGAYIRKYGVSLSGKRCVQLTALCLFVAVCIKTASVALLLPGGLNRIANRLVMSYQSPLNVINAFCMLVVFSRVRVCILSIERLCALLSATTFSVYLIHENPVVRSGILQNRFAGLVASPYMGLGCLASAVAIFAVCSGLDVIRQAIFNVLSVRQILGRCESLLVRYCEKNGLF